MKVKIDEIELKEIIMKICYEIGLRIEKEAVENLIKGGNVDTGNLMRSIHVEELGYEVDVIVDCSYAGYVEFGTGAREKYPPYDAIRGWVERKLGYKGKKADIITWKIMNAIKRRGTKPHPFLRPAIDKVISDLG